MRKFIMGIVAGIILSASVSAYANGYLSGWTVEVNGTEVCSDPYMWSSTRVIECD